MSSSDRRSISVTTSVGLDLVAATSTRPARRAREATTRPPTRATATARSRSAAGFPPGSAAFLPGSAALTPGSAEVRSRLRPRGLAGAGAGRTGVYRQQSAGQACPAVGEGGQTA